MWHKTLKDRLQCSTLCRPRERVKYPVFSHTYIVTLCYIHSRRLVIWLFGLWLVLLRGKTRYLGSKYNLELAKGSRATPPNTNSSLVDCHQYSFCIFCWFISGKNIGLEAKDRIIGKKVQHSIISSFAGDGILISGLIMFRGFGSMPNPCANASALELERSCALLAQGFLPETRFLIACALGTSPCFWKHGRKLAHLHFMRNLEIAMLPRNRRPEVWAWFARYCAIMYGAGLEKGSRSLCCVDLGSGPNAYWNE